MIFIFLLNCQKLFQCICNIQYTICNIEYIITYNIQYTIYMHSTFAKHIHRKRQRSFWSSGLLFHIIKNDNAWFLFINCHGHLLLDHHDLLLLDHHHHLLVDHHHHLLTYRHGLLLCVLRDTLLGKNMLKAKVWWRVAQWSCLKLYLSSSSNYICHRSEIIFVIMLKYNCHQALLSVRIFKL